jgi:hypothetical protein
MDIMRCQLANRSHCIYDSHDVRGSFWTTADEKVPSSVMHCTTLANAPTLSLYGSTLTRMIARSYYM